MVKQAKNNTVQPKERESEHINQETPSQREIFRALSSMALDGTFLDRMKYAGELGNEFGGDRKLYHTLGYKQILQYKDYYLRYKRQDIVKVVNDKLPKACWHNHPEVQESIPEEERTQETQFEKDFTEVSNRLKLWKTLLRLDKILGLSKYAVLFLGFNDSPDLELPVTPGAGLELKYLQVYGSEHARIKTIDDDPLSERYGLPETYRIQVNLMNSHDGQNQQDMIVHYSRVLHIVEDPFENALIGTPRMEALMNRFADLEKVLGGSAEMFWRNAKGMNVASAKEGHQMSPADKEDFDTQVDEFEHNIRNWLRLQGVDVERLDTNIQSPKDNLDALLNIVSIVTGIPKRILMGAERGELASSQDEKTWMNLIQERQTTFCEPEIIQPFIDIMIEYGILTPPGKDEYEINWPKMGSLGPKEKSEILNNRTKAIAEYAKAPGADMVVPPEVFLENEMGYTKEEVNDIMESLKGMVKEDQTGENE